MDDIRAWECLAYAYWLRRDFPSTAGILESLRNRDPEDPRYVHYLADVLWQQGDREEAARLWREVQGGIHPELATKATANLTLLGEVPLEGSIPPALV